MARLHLFDRRQSLWGLARIALAVATIWTVTSLAADLTPDEVRHQVERLGSDRLAERRAAEQTLLEGGPSILQHLPEPSSLEDAAIRDALARLRSDLEQQAGLAASQPSRVTLAGTATLADLVRTLSEQTGNRIALSCISNELREQQLTVDWRDATFWTTVVELCDAVNVVPSPSNFGAGAIELRPPDAESQEQPRRSLWTPSDCNSALLVRLADVSPRPAPGNQHETILQLRLNILAEPRLRPLFLRLCDADLDVRDAAQTLESFNPLSVREIEFSDTGEAAADVTLVAASPPERSELQVSGRFDVELIGAVSKLEFQGFDESSSRVRRRGGVSVSLDKIRRLSADTSEFQLTLRYDEGGPAFESHRIGSLYREVFLQQSNGVRVPPSLSEFTREQDGALGLRYCFTDLPEGWQEATLVCVAPTAIIRVPVEFEIEPEASP